MESLIDQTWDELGHRIEARNDVVWIRTDPPKFFTDAGIIIPDKLAAFYHGMPNPGGVAPVTKWATVIASPSVSDVEPGDRVVFMRLDFAWQDKMDDRSLFGWIREGNILMQVELDG